MKYSFIVRQEHIEKYQVDKQILSFLPEANIFSVQKTTRGAVETCFIAEGVIAEDDGIVVMDCDLEFHSKDYTDGIRGIMSQSAEDAEGVMFVSFESDLPKYSYAKIDEHKRVLRTAEKEVISNHALCGAYFFATDQGFLSAAHRLLNEKNFSKPEFYVSLLYNYLMENNETVLLAEMEEYYSYGTPK